MISPQDPTVLARLMGLMCEAIALRGAGQLPQALTALDQALVLDPGFLPLYMQRAGLLEEAGEHAAAVAAYDDCLAIAPDFADARTAQQQALHQLVARLMTQSEATLASGSAVVAANEFALAAALLRLSRAEDALVHAERAFAIDPLDVATRALRANILLRLNRHEEALACWQEHEAGKAPQRTLALFNRADILRQMGHADDVLAGYEAALALHPDFPVAQVGRAHMLLMRGEYAAGWQAHEARHRIDELAARQLRSDAPRWQPGENISGQHLLLWAEQGLGDSLQFARYIGLAAARAGRTTVCVPPGLLPLLAPSFPMCEFIVNDKAPPAHDICASLLSLPLLLGLPDPAQSPTPPYLRVDAMRIADRRVTLPVRRPRIGIAWAGRQYATINYSRDIPLVQLAPLFELPVDIVSLQLQVPDGDISVATALGERLERLPLQDWADTAAVMENLDLVVTVDTAVAHLAGALGRPVWLMLRLEGEWRWGQEAGRTPWYPSMRLFRQSVRGEWGDVVERVRAACLALASAGAGAAD